MEVGVNTFGVVNYSHNEELESISNHTKLSQDRIEVGLKFQSGDRSNFSLGISTDGYSYYNTVFVPTNSENNLEVRSLFNLNYLGANLGYEISIFENEYVTVNANLRLSGSILESGTRTDDVLNAPSSIISTSSTNLLNENFRSVWINLQYGYVVSHKISDYTSLHFRHFINNNISENNTSSENYNFLSHAFSFGLTLYPWSK